MSVAQSEIPPAPAPVEFRYSQTEAFPPVLRQLGASLVITTYQANKVLVARAMGEGLSMLVRTFDRPMGLATRDGRDGVGLSGTSTCSTPFAPPRNGDWSWAR